MHIHDFSPGKSNPYCELTVGAQCYTSRPISDTLNPKWNFSCQFFIKDLYQDVLCITVFEKDQFSPDGQWMIDTTQTRSHKQNGLLGFLSSLSCLFRMEGITHCMPGSASVYNSFF